MIAFDAVVGVLLGVVKRVRDELFDDGLECLGEIGDDFVWFAVGVERWVEECSGGSKISSWRDEDVDDLAVFIYGSVDVPPFAGDLHVGLVDEPSAANGVSSGSGGVDEQGSEALDPSVDGDVVDLDAAFD